MMPPDLLLYTLTHIYTAVIPYTQMSVCVCVNTTQLEIKGNQHNNGKCNFFFFFFTAE